MDIRKYFPKAADSRSIRQTAAQPAAKKQKRANAVASAAAAAAVSATRRPPTNEGKQTPSTAVASLRSEQHQQSKVAMTKRRKWVQKHMCFVCHQDCDGLEACQCFEKNGGIKGFGMMFCQECDDDGVYQCAGPCGERLCFRSCEYSRCFECHDNYCQTCLADEDVMSKCGSCDTIYCERCLEQSERRGGDEEILKRCHFCDKDCCKECDKTIQPCEFCVELVCDKCIDKRFDPEDGRGCVSCGQGTAEGFAREDAMIRRYGADYERYM